MRNYLSLKKYLRLLNSPRDDRSLCPIFFGETAEPSGRINDNLTMIEKTVLKTG